MVRLLKQLRFLIIYAVCVCLLLSSVFILRDDPNSLLFWALFIQLPVAISIYISPALFGGIIQWKNNNSMFTIIILSVLVYISIFIACFFYKFALTSYHENFIEVSLSNAKTSFIFMLIFFIFSCLAKIIQKYLSKKESLQQDYENFDEHYFDLFK